jgi:cyclopropane fatty-acyl-phospholipid synthase-like methyltransferase
MNSAAEDVIGLYERHAMEWVADRQRTSFAERAWLERFVALLPADESVLDVGCGSGEPIARYLMSRGFDVTGVDGSEAMIALCRKSYPDRSWILADMRTLSLARAFQGIVAWDSFFHLARNHQRRVIRIFRDHLASRGALMFTSGTSHGETIGSFRGEPLYHASLSPEEYRALLSECGFAVIAHIPEDPRCGRRTVWLAQLLQ